MSSLVGSGVFPRVTVVALLVSSCMPREGVPVSEEPTAVALRPIAVAALDEILAARGSADTVLHRELRSTRNREAMKRELVSPEELAEVITQAIRQPRLGGPDLAVTTAKILHYQEPEPEGSNWSCLMARPAQDVPVETVQEMWSEVIPELRRKYNLTASARKTRAK